MNAYANQLLQGSSFCHKVELEKNGNFFYGIYNGLSTWALIYSSTSDELIQELWVDDPTDEERFSPSYYFTREGYKMLD